MLVVKLAKSSGIPLTVTLQSFSCIFSIICLQSRCLSSVFSFQSFSSWLEGAEIFVDAQGLLLTRWAGTKSGSEVLATQLLSRHVSYAFPESSACKQAAFHPTSSCKASSAPEPSIQSPHKYFAYCLSSLICCVEVAKGQTETHQTRPKILNSFPGFNYRHPRPTSKWKLRR